MYTFHVCLQPIVICKSHVSATNSKLRIYFMCVRNQLKIMYTFHVCLQKFKVIYTFHVSATN